MSRVIYPARRAIEHAVTVPDVRPSRLFPVLWPLWQVETSAQVYDEQAYEVLDRFLVRGILEAGLTRSADLAAFYGLPDSLVDRCLTFLSLIGHARLAEGVVTLTPLGESSARAGIRYVPKESRQQLLVERFTARPLPRSHYQGSLSLLPIPDVPAERVSDGSHFAPLFSPSTFRPEIVTRLGERPDRFDFNLPKQLRNLRVLGHQDAYLPAYLIEGTDGRLLAYSGVGGERDTFLESVCDRVPMIRQLMAAEPSQDPREIWTGWLADGKRKGTLRHLPSGVWRATLIADSFGGTPKLPLSRIGSYQLRKRHFAQIWTDDTKLRRQAAMQRALAMTQLREVRTRADLTSRLRTVAEQLEVTTPTLDELHRYAKREQLHTYLVHLDALE
ncbi:hypothetical protein OG792_20860 [Micromonospora sp. NBC_01699]|uniref:hypothetical protein n=1 Tax=Micromonospora sp. NBC_01699 TaxID=2975984 RepID=UPI002E2DEBC8|nr:hypothetical protein [Micromonospora sp. NBC_01699]